MKLLRSRDFWTGVLLIGFAGAYYASADNIPDSLLSDAVGAGGLPKLLAIALGIAGALLALSGRSRSGRTGDGKLELKPLWLVAMIGSYIFLLPLLGYSLSVGVLIACCAIFAGARPILTAILVAAAGAVVFELIFVRLLHVSMPAGLLLHWT